MQSDFLLNYERPFIYHLSRALTNNAYTKHLTERICEDLNKTNTDIFRNLRRRNPHILQYGFHT